LPSAIVKEATHKNGIAPDDPRRRGSQSEPNDRQITLTIKLFALPDLAPVVPFVTYKTGARAFRRNTSLSSRLALPRSNILMERSDVGNGRHLQRLHVVPHTIEAVMVMV
jgi:hypothetical protein